jgi:transmembrane 9 superfamily member 2/4
MRIVLSLTFSLVITAVAAMKRGLTKADVATSSSTHIEELGEPSRPDIQRTIMDKKTLNRKERKQVFEAEIAVYNAMRAQGADEVSNTPDSVALRNIRLRKKKRKGLFSLRQGSLSEILFPGATSNDYVENEPLAVYTDLVESRNDPVPYSYNSLPYCSPKLKSRRPRNNIGSRLQGRGAETTVAPFDFRFKENKGCTVMCMTKMDAKTVERLQKLIHFQYRVHLTLDQLPVLMRSKEYNYAIRGYPIGFVAPESMKVLKAGEYYMFNHLKFVVTYNAPDSGGYNVVGFDVHPTSVKHTLPKDVDINSATTLPTCDGAVLIKDPARFVELQQPSTDLLSMVYSYEVEWVESTLPWSNRWDVYLIGAPDDDLHYISFWISLAVVLSIIGGMSAVLIRTLRQGIALYNDEETPSNGIKESSWMLLHGDVFRPPQTSPMALVVLVGTGAQICAAFGLTLVLSVLHVCNPLKKGQMLTALLIVFALCGVVAGYVSSRLGKFIDPNAWKLGSVLSATIFPCLALATYTVLNAWLASAGAATGVGMFPMLQLLGWWASALIPMAAVGALLGSKSPKLQVPTKTNDVALAIEPTPWYCQPYFAVPFGGFLPFGTVAIELAFVQSALWLHQWYYQVGFLLVTWLMLIASCTVVSVSTTYIRLCARDHGWWWIAFLQSASMGGYVFLYSLWFLFSRFQLDGVLPLAVYLTYMGMISICIGLACGSVGFMASFLFVKTIYRSVDPL